MILFICLFSFVSFLLWISSVEAALFVGTLSEDFFDLITVKRNAAGTLIAVCFSQNTLKGRAHALEMHKLKHLCSYREHCYSYVFGEIQTICQICNFNMSFLLNFFSRKCRFLLIILPKHRADMTLTPLITLKQKRKEWGRQSDRNATGIPRNHPLPLLPLSPIAVPKSIRSFNMQYNRQGELFCDHNARKC